MIVLRFPAIVNVSAYVPQALLAVLLSWLLANKQVGILLFTATSLIAITIAALLAIVGTEVRLTPAELAEIVFLAKVFFHLASGILLFSLVRREYVRRQYKVLSQPSLVILLSVISLCFGLSGLDVKRPTTEDGTRQTVAFWWPPIDQEAQDEYTEANRGTGLDNIGLFGELPASLVRSGHCVKKLTAVEADSLSDVAVLCLLAPFRPITSVEKQSIHDFVANGGKLLIAAEHTNLDNNREIYNDLLSPYGISINFDTVTSLVDNTTRGTKATHCPIGALFTRYQSCLAYNRGASLQLHGWKPSPVLIARVWHSDSGDETNGENSGIGDELWTEGDAVGNLVLVASWENSKGGMVVVFGDTSPFINRNIPYNESFIHDFFGYLGCRPSRSSTIQVWLLLIAGLWSTIVTGICLLLIRHTRRSSAGERGVRVAALAPFVVFCFFLEPSVAKFDSLAPRVFLSTDENNGFSKDGFSPHSLTSLGVAALRCNCSVVIGSWREATPSDVIFIVNPTTRVSLDRIITHVNAGGTAVISGAGDNQYFRKLADSLGVSLGQVPLGALDGSRLKAYSAWELLGDSVAWESLMAGEVSVGLVSRGGNGKLVLMADGGFFCSQNLEDSDQREEKNAQFLEYLFAR